MSERADVAERIAITVHPASADSDSLTVSDAMRQVLDLVEALGHIDRAEGDAAQIVWRLESATTNSPFTVVAAATAPDPTLSVALEANRVISTFSDALNGLLEDGRKTDSLSDDAARAIGRALKRNLNGIGRTDIQLLDEGGPPIYIVPLRAQRGLNTLERAALDDVDPNLTRSEFGAHEGEIVGIARHFRKPALIVRDRISGETFAAVLPEQLAKELGPSHRWKEAWEGERVLVSGELHYNGAGALRRLDVQAIETIHSRDVTLADLEGIDLLHGHSVVEQIDKLWDVDA